MHILAQPTEKIDPNAQHLADLNTLNALPAAYFSEKEQAIRQRNAKAFQQLEKKKANAERLAKELAQRETRTQIAHDKLKAQSKSTRHRITRNTLDDAFSQCVRLRSNCTCERCGLPFHFNNMKWLHCSHNYSRDIKQLRFHPDNAFALCKDCHWWFAKNKTESTAWFTEKLGKARFHHLRQALTNPEPSKDELARLKIWYSLTARQLRRLREAGNTEYLAFSDVPKRP